MAASILLYLLKANLALVLFAGAYFGLLRRLTFFSLNRAYLLFTLLFAAVYPALPVPALLPPVATQPAAFAVVEMSGMGPDAVAGPAAPALDWAVVGLAAYAAGAAVLLVRLLVQLLSLWRLRRTSRPAVLSRQAVRTLPGEVSPFSFWQTIYLNPDQHPAPELAAVLRHEQVHVRQWHTLDVLLVQVALAAAWCNPAAWLLRRALLDNLEYLADHAALQTGLDRRAYQYSLLRLSQVAAGPALVSHFTFPTLKNRVAMMNTPFSSPGQLAHYFVAGPLVLGLALGASGARAQEARLAVPVAADATLAAKPANSLSRPLVYVDGQRSDNDLDSFDDANIASISVYKGAAARQVFGEAAAEKVIVLTTKANRNRPDVVAFNQQLTAKQAQAPLPKATTVVPAARQQPIRPSLRVAKPMPLQPVASQNAAALPQASSASKPNNPQPVYYVDGKAQTGGIDNIKPDNIASMHVLKGEEAITHTRLLLGNDAVKNGIVFITTKQNQNQPEVRAFNEKLGIAAAAPAPAVPSASTGTPYLAPPALAYITQHYPDARLIGVAEVKPADGGPTRYQAHIVIGRRPGYLLFDGAGQFISESYTR